MITGEIFMIRSVAMEVCYDAIPIGATERVSSMLEAALR